ncbi:MAG: DUF4388 domain-containing protein [Myxococcota bacterium]|jgi:Tfp pilus assembly protein PilZ|nr:DUF4388 domain-containing protein [Myxococcota bacterium]
MLAVTFDDLESFSREFHTNLTKGGIFVPTEEGFGLRSSVEVGVDLRFCGESVVLSGEVVHCVVPELASAGAVPGVAIQFDRSVSELRALFKGMVGDIPEPDAEAPPPAARDGRARRIADRHSARVAVRVATLDGMELHGVTRNLSVSGLLFSVSDEGLEIGELVVVTLEDSEAGESVEIPAEVVRHVEGDADDVMALGIHFDLDPERDSWAQGFLKRVCDQEYTRRLGGITGDIEELGLASLLQSFGQSSPEGTLTVLDGPHEGAIAFENGLLVASVLGRVRGRKALARMLQWTSGSFEFHARVDDTLERDAPEYLDCAILEAMREVDEASAREPIPLGPRTRFRVVDVAHQEIAGDLGKLECAIVDLASVGATLRKLLDVIPESDTSIEAAVRGLVDSGVLEEDATPD